MTELTEPAVKLDVAPVDSPEMGKQFILRDSHDFIVFPVSVRIKNTDAATSANYGQFFIAPFPCTLVRAYERHNLAGSDAGTVECYIEKLPTLTSKGSGINMLASNFNLKSTASLTQTKEPSTGVLNGTLNKSLATGEAMGVFHSGTLTAVNDVVITVLLKVELSKLPV